MILTVGFFIYPKCGKSAHYRFYSEDKYVICKNCGKKVTPEKLMEEKK